MSNASKKIILGLLLLGFLTGFYLFRPQSNPNAMKPESHGILNMRIPSMAGSFEKAITVPVGTPEDAAEVSKKIDLLHEILLSKNDNDPRLDTQFKNLSPELKAALRAEYKKIADEKRNDRGTLVFLLGREVRGVEDQAFFKSVLEEKPCLSLADCAVFTAPGTQEEQHMDSVNQTTLAYPQIMALKMQEEVYSQAATPALKESALQLIRAAAQSPVARVAQEAQTILSRIAP